MSEDKPVQASTETGADGAASAAPGSADSSIDAVIAAALEVAKAASPSIAPDHEALPGAAAPKVEASPAEAQRQDDRPDASGGETRSDTERAHGKLIVMSPADRIGEGAGPKAEAAQGASTPRGRRVAAMAAVIVLATLAGALGGALATAGITRLIGFDQKAGKNSELEAQLARIDADMSVLKLSVEHNSKIGMSQFNKTGERLDKLEKAQAEPAARLAKLSEAVDKLRSVAPVVPAAAPAAPAASTQARETTGSIAPQSVAAATPAAVPPAPAAPPKTEPGRLPTVEGWVLRDVSHGGALIEGRQGLYEVYAGDPVPGLGRIDAIRRQDGRWVVVTSRGLIVAR